MKAKLQAAAFENLITTLILLQEAIDVAEFVVEIDVTTHALPILKVEYIF